MFKVMIHPADYDNVRNAVDSAFEHFPTQVTGKKVLIKPNVLRSSEAEEGIVTHPAVLRSVVEKVEAMDPASIIVGDIGLILASDNAVAMDSVMAVMMGLEPIQLRFLQKAKELGLGENDLDKIEIIGELKKLPDYKIPPLGGEVIMNNEAIQEMIHSRTLLLPQVASDLCTACESCIEQCPVSALSMNGDIPQVDADTCITCFCCQEICPEKAITLK